MLEAFHRFAALDVIDLRPAKSGDEERSLLFPGEDDEPVVLADITDIALERLGDRWVLRPGATVDTSVRPSHVATSTIEDLLCGPAFAASGGGEGPRVEPDSVVLLTEKAIEFRVNRELLDASVRPAAFSVTWFDRERGWQVSNVVSAAYGGGETRTVNLELGSAVSGRVRLIVYGTGPTPLLGADLVPLAGAVGSPARGTPHDGHDFVHMQEFAPADEPRPAEAEAESIEIQPAPSRPRRPRTPRVTEEGS